MQFKTPLVVGALLWLASILPVPADPVTFKEVSLLVRMKETPEQIVGQVSKRKLIQPLTQAELGTLRSQGATEALLQTLQDPRFFLSAKEADLFNRRKAAQLAVAKQDEENFAQASAAKATAEAATANDQSTDFKYAKEAIERGKPLSLSRFRGPDIDLFMKNRDSFYGIEIVKNNGSAPIPRAVVVPKGASPAVQPGTAMPIPPAMSSLSSDRKRMRIEKRDPVTIPTERGDLYLLYVDKPSGLHVYYLDDQAAPVNTDLLIVSPKKF
jgi:hypothetical protein